MLPLTFGFAWLIAANLTAMLPTRDHHWRAAYALMTLGLPLLIWIFATHGALWTTAFLAAGCSILRWPLYYLGLWVRARMIR
jgi:hypothetical protein